MMCAQVAIVHHLDMPIMRQRAFHIAPGTENQIPITPTLYTANPQVQREINMEIIIGSRWFCGFNINVMI